MKTNRTLALAALVLSGASFGFAADASVTPPAAAAPAATAKAAHPKRDELLQRFDANHDGKLDDTEKAAAKAAMQKNRGKGRDELLKRFDANGDGKLDETEKAAAKKWREEHGKGKGHAAPDAAATDTEAAK